MVGAMSVVAGSLMDAKTCPCLDLSLQRSTITKRNAPWSGSLELSCSSFANRSSVKALSGSKKLKKQRKNQGRLVVVNNLGGQYEDNFEDVKRQLLDYFTYKAVRTVLNQLYEMNPTDYRWFYNHVASNEHGYGKHFIRNLQKEKHDLAERVMVTRLHLYGKWIKRCDHTEMYERISDQNLELMRERLIETVVWPTDETNADVA